MRRFGRFCARSAWTNTRRFTAQSNRLRRAIRARTARLGRPVSCWRASIRPKAPFTATRACLRGLKSPCASRFPCSMRTVRSTCWRRTSMTARKPRSSCRISARRFCSCAAAWKTRRRRRISMSCSCIWSTAARTASSPAAFIRRTIAGCSARRSPSAAS